MDCVDFRRQWDEWHEGLIGAQLLDALDAHLTTCDHCRRYDFEMRRMLSSLRRLEAPAMRKEFPAEALARARVPVRWGMQRIGLTAAAAALVAGIAITLLVGRPVQDTNSDTRLVQLPVQQVEVLQLVMMSPQDLEGVRFSVELPPHVQIEGYPGQRTLSWEGGLSSGRNGLALPLIADRTLEGELVARVEHAGLRKEIRLRLKANDPDRHGKAG